MRTTRVRVARLSVIRRKVLESVLQHVCFEKTTALRGIGSLSRVELDVQRENFVLKSFVCVGESWARLGINKLSMGDRRGTKL